MAFLLVKLMIFTRSPSSFRANIRLPKENLKLALLVMHEAWFQAKNVASIHGREWQKK